MFWFCTEYDLKDWCQNISVSSKRVKCNYWGIAYYQLLWLGCFCWLNLYMWPGSNSTYRRVLKGVQTNATHSMPPAVTLCCWQGANIQSVTGRARASNATATMWVCSSIDWEELKRSSSLPWPEVQPHHRAYSPSEYDQTRSPTTPQGLQSKWYDQTRCPTTLQGLQSKWVWSNQKFNHTTGLTVQASTIKPEVQPHHSPSEYNQMVASPISV